MKAASHNNAECPWKSLLCDNPTLYIPCPGGEVHPDLEEPARVGGERKGILHVLDLLKGLLRTAVQFD